MKKKRILAGVIIVAIVGSAWFGYGEYSRKVKDLRNVKPQVTIQSNDLIVAYEKDEPASNKVYLDKIIEVKGNIKEISKDEAGHFTFVLGEEGSMSSVRCSMDEQHSQKLKELKTGMTITIKGSCTGFNSDELLGSDVILNRCVVDN